MDRKTIINRINERVSKSDSELERALAEFTIGMCAIKKIRTLEEIAMIIKFTKEEKKEIAYKESLIRACTDKLVDTIEAMNGVEPDDYDEIEKVSKIQTEIQNQIGILYRELWDYRKKCIESHINTITKKGVFC